MTDPRRYARESLTDRIVRLIDSSHRYVLGMAILAITSFAAAFALAIFAGCAS